MFDSFPKQPTSTSDWLVADTTSHHGITLDSLKCERFLQQIDKYFFGRIRTDAGAPTGLQLLRSSPHAVGRAP